MSSAQRAGELEAIRSFVMGTQPVTEKAAAQRDDFIRRWDSLGWYDKTFPDDSIYDEMKNRENQYWIANRPPLEQASAAQTVRENPTDQRQTSGGVFPQDERIEDVKAPDIEMLDEQIEDAKPLFDVPSWVAPVALGGFALALGLAAAKGIAKLNPAALLARFTK